MKALWTAVLITTLSTPVFAMTAENLYKSCKIFADNAFSYGDDISDVTNAAICESYVVATIHNAATVCKTYSNAKEALEG